RRFHFERDRRRFTVARSHLRAILARYLNEVPAAIEFSYGPRGKPSLAGRFESNSLRFNLSHSGERALLAVSRDVQLGADIEENRPIDDHSKIAERFFSAGEKAVMRALRPDESLEGFYRCWTCKEAYVKATGDGLARPTESFDVVFLPPEQARLVSVDQDPSEASRWTLLAFTPEQNYIAAVVIEGDVSTVSCFQSIV